jgi:hypothetical protein
MVHPYLPENEEEFDPILEVLETHQDDGSIWIRAHTVLLKNTNILFKLPQIL